MERRRAGFYWARRQSSGRPTIIEFVYGLDRLLIWFSSLSKHGDGALKAIEDADRWLNTFVALGMLKLDEPNYNATNPLTSIGLSLQGIGNVPSSQIAKLQNALDFLRPKATPLELKYWLEISGLTVTEK